MLGFYNASVSTDARHIEVAKEPSDGDELPVAFVDLSEGPDTHYCAISVAGCDEEDAQYRARFIVRDINNWTRECLAHAPAVAKGAE